MALRASCSRSTLGALLRQRCRPMRLEVESRNRGSRMVRPLRRARGDMVSLSAEADRCTIARPSVSHAKGCNYVCSPNQRVNVKALAGGSRWGEGRGSRGYRMRSWLMQNRSATYLHLFCFLNLRSIVTPSQHCHIFAMAGAESPSASILAEVPIQQPRCLALQRED